jgi:hypothetical protein
MKMDCEIVRDLLPLYADNACSGKSRDMVEEHLMECPDCRDLMDRLRETEIEEDLQSERESVIQYGIRRFRRRTAAVGSAVSGVLLVPILLCLVANLLTGPSLSWVSVVLAAVCVLASLVVVPIVVPEDKLFWTFCAFCASLLLLLGVACLYTRGDWFWIASSAVLFGLSAIFLPFVIRARPVQRLIGSSNRWIIVLGVDIALFINMLNMIETRGRLTLNSILFTLGVIAGIGVVVFEIIRKRGAAK